MLRDCLIDKFQKGLGLLLDRFVIPYRTQQKGLGLSKMMPRILIRKSRPQDINFIRHSYLKNNWYDKRNSTLLPKKVWVEAQAKRIQMMIDTQSVYVASLCGDPNLIFGYGFWDIDKPFIYIKKHFRGLEDDLEKQLLEIINKEKQ